MQYIVFIIIFIFGMHAQAQSAPMLSDLASLKWNNRVIILYDTKNQNKSLQLLNEQLADINNRDIIWFIINDDKAKTNYAGTLSLDFVSSVHKKLSAARGKVILIGKDGGIKSQSEYLNLDAIFSKIDAMPMRQVEMNQK